MLVSNVKRIGIVGAGVMGHGIAQVCARSGFDVIILDVSLEILDKSLQLIMSGPFGLMKLVEKGKLTKEEAHKIMLRVKATTDLKEFCKDLDLLIEAIPEDPELKKKIFKQLDELCPEKTVFASNTSGIMITDLASAIRRKEKFIGMHWFNPAPVMPLVEVVRGASTSDETFSLIMELSKRMGKVPIEVRDGPGFFTTRFINSWLMEAVRLFELNVAGIKEIDEMCKLAFRFPMGPFELMDLVGLDTALHVAEYIYSMTHETHCAPPITLRKLVSTGYLGNPDVKPGSKGGWYEFYKIKKEKI